MDRPVLLVTRMLPTYRVPVLEALDERLGGRLVVGSGAPPEGSSLESLAAEPPYPFSHVPLSNTWIGGQTLHLQRYGRLFEAHPRPAVVLAEESPRTVSLPYLLFAARRRGAGRILWGHFSSNDRRFSPHHPLDRYRLEMARRVEACVCYTDAIRRHLSGHLEKKRLFVARNTVDISALISARQELEAEGRRRVRARLDLPEDRAVLLFVGRLIPSKGTELLMEVFARLRSERPATLVVVGTGPDRSRMERMAEERGMVDVRFPGAITDEHRLAPYLYAADLLVNPGYLGLSVNQAFAMGLPVVAREAPPDRRYHSPEISYLRSGENSVLAPWGDDGSTERPDESGAGSLSSEAVDGLVRAVKTGLDRRETLSRGALRFAEESLTLARMVEGLAEAVRYAESSTARS